MVAFIQEAEASKNHSIETPANLMQLRKHKYLPIMLLWAILGLGIEVHMGVDFRVLPNSTTINCLNKSIFNLLKIPEPSEEPGAE